MWSLSISATVNYNDERKSKDRALQEVQHEFVESLQDQARLQEELRRKEDALRDTQIRSMHELEKMKRAQIQQVVDSKIKRENHETIQQLTTQLQQLQEQINSMNSTGDFQDIESNYSGRLSHVSGRARTPANPHAVEQSVMHNLPRDASGNQSEPESAQRFQTHGAR